MPGPSAQARGGDACLTSAWEKGRLSSTQSPHPAPRARAPQSRWKDIRQHPPPPARIYGPSLALLPTAWHRQGCLSPEVYRGRKLRVREARHPAQGYAALA